MSKRSRPRPEDSQLYATLLESRPGVPKPIHDSIDVDELPGVHTAPVRNSDVLASVDAKLPRRNLLALLESRTDHTSPPQVTNPVRAALRAKLERAARESREARKLSRARRARR